MKEYRDWKIIGVDTGYGNVKTANCCFPAGLSAHSAEPAFKDDLLIYDGMYYQIGTGHKEFAADKTRDDDYYTLTLAAIARELELYGLVSGKVRLAVGLPLTWVSQQREDFKAYLMRSREVSFTFRGKVYRVENVMRTHHATVDDSILNRVLRFGTADIQEDYLRTIQETAAEYVREIFRILREREYNPALMRLYVLGGGSCLIRNFGEYDADRVTINEDICATAKGYEFLCEQALRRSNG